MHIDIHAINKGIEINLAMHYFCVEILETSDILTKV